MIIRSVRYQDGLPIEESSGIPDTGWEAQNATGYMLVAATEPDTTEMTRLADTFRLPQLAVEDGLEGHQRPKLDDYGDCVFAVVRTVHCDETTLQTTVGEVHAFLGASYAILIGRAAPDAIQRCCSRLDEHPHLATLGPIAVLWALLDGVIDDGERVADVMLEEEERIEQNVFEGDTDQSRPIFVHRRRLDQLLRAAHPVLPILETLERGDAVATPQQLRPYLKDVGDHARRLTEALMQLSSRTDGLLSANLARVTVRQNETMQKVSAWAAIAAAPTIIAGIYGMNFRTFPELEWPFGYPLAITMMIAAVLGLRSNFRRLGWL